MEIRASFEYDHTTMEFSVEIENPSNIVRKLKIRVGSKIVSDRLQRGFADVQKTAKVKGFRPGHVPIDVVKKMYGTDVRHQVFHDLIDENYRRALREKSVRAVSQPKIETPDHKTGEGTHDHSINEGQDLVFTATVEILPEIEVKSYTGFSLKKESETLTDQDVEIVIKNMLDSQAQLVPASSGLLGADGTSSSRPAKMGDFADIQFSGGIVTESGYEEKEGMKGSKMIELGSKSLIEGFEEEVVGMRSGETKTFEVKFPDDYHEKSIAGKPARFTVSLGEIKEKKLPEFNDDFAKNLGYENVSDLKSKAREHLEKEKKGEVERKLRSDLFKLLIEKNPFDVPSSLVHAQTRQLAQEVGDNLKRQGFNDQMIQEAVVGELENLKIRAENQVRSSLLLEAVSKKENITVTPAEIDQEIAKSAVNMNLEEQKVREFYEQNPERRNDLEYRLREDKTVEFILSKSKIK